MGAKLAVLKNDVWSLDQRTKGQSILEFLMLLPFIMGLSMIMIRMNTAIQVSIVNQQYARTAVLGTTYNSASYPTLNGKVRQILDGKWNQLVVGVSENPPLDFQSYVPKAPESLVTRSKKIPGPNQPHDEPNERASVRIRNTVTLCTPTYVLRDQNQNVQDLSPINGGEYLTTHHLVDTTTWGSSICGSDIPYL